MVPLRCSRRTPTRLRSRDVFVRSTTRLFDPRFSRTHVTHSVCAVSLLGWLPGYLLRFRLPRWVYYRSNTLPVYTVAPPPACGFHAPLHMPAFTGFLTAPYLFYGYPAFAATAYHCVALPTTLRYYTHVRGSFWMQDYTAVTSRGSFHTAPHLPATPHRSLYIWFGSLPRFLPGLHTHPAHLLSPAAHTHYWLLWSSFHAHRVHCATVTASLCLPRRTHLLRYHNWFTTRLTTLRSYICCPHRAFRCSFTTHIYLPRFTFDFVIAVLIPDIPGPSSTTYRLIPFPCSWVSPTFILCRWLSLPHYIRILLILRSLITVIWNTR